MDMLLATGEQISIALTAMAIHELGERAVSFTGPQIGIVTDSTHRKARIKKIDTVRLCEALDTGHIVVLAGFQGVDELKANPDGSLEILERIEGGRHQVSRCLGPPALFGWATGTLPEPKNNPQIGMINMRTVMPSLQKAKPVKLNSEGLSFATVALPKQLRQTRVVKDQSPDAIAKEIVEWLKK